MRSFNKTMLGGETLADTPPCPGGGDHRKLASAN